MYGKEMTLDEVFKEASSDKIFYQGTGGGVTVSGGQPLLYVAFVTELFKACHEAKIHTCIETAGLVGSEVVRQVLPFTDLVLFDLKHMDSERHRELCGQPNELILENAKIVAESGVKMLCRTPVIPGLNDGVENIRETALFVKSLRDDIALELLPYHRMGSSKYLALDMVYQTESLPPHTSEQLDVLQHTVERAGVTCILGGHALTAVRDNSPGEASGDIEGYCWPPMALCFGMERELLPLCAILCWTTILRICAARRSPLAAWRSLRPVNIISSGWRTGRTGLQCVPY